jgi:NitT/TauT family transport system ATP-binding protein
MTATVFDPPTPRIELRAVSRIYQLRNARNGSTSLTAIDNLDLTIRQGEFAAIVGPTGCGKSTVLDLIAGLSFPQSGQIFVNGQLVKGPSPDRGIVLQGYALFPWRTVRQNVEFGLEIKGIDKRERKTICDRFIDLVGLKGAEDRLPHELSGGMKQRVAIARALACDPSVLLMDEPFAAVDAQTREALQDELLRIWEATRKTIVFVTHSIEEAVFLADRVIVLSTNPGRLNAIVDVDLPRPRLGSVRTTTQFVDLRKQLLVLLEATESLAPEAREAAS